MAQHARPNCSGHTEFLRPQLYSSSKVAVKTPCFCNSLLSPSSICLTLDLNRHLTLNLFQRGERNKITSKSKIKKKLHFHVNTPFCHAQTSPSTNSSRKTIIAMNAPAPKLVNATAKGSRKIVSTSKI